MKTFRLIPVALGLALSPVVASASATPATAPLSIYQAPVGPMEASKSSTFVVSPELGRAWVEITKNYSWSDSPAEVVRVPVEGLRYDAARNAVVLDAAGKQLECAKVVERGVWVFKGPVAEPTGQCQLMQRYVEVPVDNGFGVHRVEKFEVLLHPAS